MLFRLGLPHQIDGLCDKARLINGLTSTDRLDPPFHFLESLAIFEDVVDPLQELSCGGRLGDLPSLLTLHLIVEPS